MKVSYYPGCALHGTALEYEESTKGVSASLGVELGELPDWNCCGASSAHATDDSLAHGLVARNLAIAEKEGRNLLVPCAACYSRFKAGEREMETGAHKLHFRILSLPEFLVEAGPLDRTGGISPVSRCSKSLFNGPCGGSKGGKCEIDSQVDCGWQLIYDRMKELGQLEKLEEPMPVKDWSFSRDGGPRKRVREDLRI